jgi:hypothetical protein
MTTKVIGGVEVTPEILADLFWELGSDEQADFFADLYRLAGHKLCIQMSWVVREIAHRSGDAHVDAVMGFLSFADCANGYGDDATDIRVSDAKHEIARMALAATGGTP